jgi:2-polyprenyl-3-methyl-5-hydroxy-6-metoxy-1,4-benzoquinol methylase
LCGQQQRALEHFEQSLRTAGDGGDVRLLVGARVEHSLGLTTKGQIESTCELDKADFNSRLFNCLYSLEAKVDGHSLSCLFNANVKNAAWVQDDSLFYDVSKPLYFVTSASGSFEKTALTQFQFRPGKEYKIEGFLANSGTTSPVFWFFQYIGDERIQSKNVPTVNGRFQVRIVINDKSTSQALGIRVAGNGQIDIKSSFLLIESSDISIEEVGKKWAEETCKFEFDSQHFFRHNERPVEYSFLFDVLRKYYPSNILDVGTGTTSLPHLLRHCGSIVTAIDNVYDYWADDIVNRHYYVINDDITNTQLPENIYDLVICISVLEHIVNFDAAIDSMVKVLSRNGLLVVTCPFSQNEYVKNVYKLPGSSYGQSAPYITQSFSGKNVESWLKRLPVELIQQEFWQFWTGDKWTVGDQIIPPIKVNSQEKHQHTCMLFRKTS